MPVFESYCYIVSTLSVFLNGSLLLISSHRSIEAIQELRYFLSNVAVAGGCFSICLLLLQPQMVTRGTLTIRVPHGPAQYFSETFVKATASLSIVFYLYGTLSYPLFFIYRSMILSNSATYGQYFNKRNLLATFFIIFIYCCLEGTCLYYSNIEYEDLFDRLNRTSDALQDFQDKITTNQQGITQVGPGVASPDFTTPPPGNASGVISSEEMARRRIPLFGDDYTRNPLILYFHGIAVFSHAISYIIILATAHNILKTLKKKQNTMSLETLSKNELLVHAVFAEAFLPLVLAAPVAANALLTTLYENSLEWQEYLPMYLISLVPLLSPLISIFFVPAYRRCVLDLVTLKSFRKEKPQPQVNDEVLTVQETPTVEVSNNL